MNNTYYCRIYVKMGNDRILIPIFIEGNTEKEVDRALGQIIVAIADSEHYKPDGYESKVSMSDYSMKGEFVNVLSSGKLGSMGLEVNGDTATLCKYPASGVLIVSVGTWHLKAGKKNVTVNAPVVNLNGNDRDYPVLKLNI